jgi:TPR repeat protein
MDFQADHKCRAVQHATSGESNVLVEVAPVSSPEPPERKRPYASPQLVRPDPARLVEQLRGAATDGNVVAQFMLGYALECGISGPPELSAAVHWYRKAALHAAKSAR